MVQVRVEGWPTISAEEGRTLLEICEDAGIPIESACGGFACCNSCRVDVIEGAAGLSEQLPEEAPFLESPHQRLACQACIQGPVTVRLSPGV